MNNGNYGIKSIARSNQGALLFEFNADCELK